jgi:GTP pyrophosphokinase
MENLKTDLEQDEVFVFTPKGKVVTLPRGSTPVDFAYAVHTEIGHTCIGAKINGRLVSLDSALRSGDTCEIFTSKLETAAPSRDWLQFAVSPRARNKIRQWFSRERRTDMIEAGREELTREFRRAEVPLQRVWKSEALADEIESAGYGDLDGLLAAVGEHHVSAQSLAQKVARAYRNSDDDQMSSSVLNPQRARRSRKNPGVIVEGLDDVLIRLSKCCTPVPGDEIIGFVTRGRGVSVHRADCANAESLMTEQAPRLIEVEWADDQAGTLFRAAVEVIAFDRSKLLRDVANSLSEQHVNIVACSTHTGSDRVARMRFEFEMADPSHLESVLRTIKTIDAVYDAYRLVPGKGD